MSKSKAVLGGLILCIWIAAAGCAGQNTAVPSVAAGATTADSAEAAGTAETGTVHCWASVTLEGGSGRASVESPCPVYEREGELFAQILWSSSHYDYMIVDGEKYLPVNSEGNSRFEIPLSSGTPAGQEGSLSGLPEDCVLQVQADTTAMSTQHLIEYALHFRFFSTREEAEEASPDGEDAATEEEGTANRDPDPQRHVFADEKAPVLPGLQFAGQDTNEFAEGYRIYRYEGGYSVLAVDDGRSYLLVPEGAKAPETAGTGGLGELIVLQQPLDRIYLAASAVMCQLDAVGAVQNVILSGLEKDRWHIDAARQAMEDGTLLYGGKYSAPDYEKIVALGTDLAVESTMIFHAPKVKEKLEKLGIPVLIDRSSYESEPLGRAEWVKVYGLLTGREEEAARAFAVQKEYVEALAAGRKEEPAVKIAVFSVNSARQVVTRTPGDYFAKMAETAGGTLLTPAEDSGRATQTVSMEAFYAAAEEADILFYNASIEDAPESLAQLCAKDSVLTQFKAVNEGNVWCMRANLYQNAGRTGEIIRDLHAIVTGDAGDETEFFYRLK